MAKTFRKLQVTQLTSDFEKAVKIVEETIPKPKTGEVLVRNLYAGVNATDINITAGRYSSVAGKALPFDIGIEAIGVIEAVGENVTIEPGKHVIFVGFKAYSEYLIANESEVIPVDHAKPEYLAFVIVGLTASIGLDEAGHIRKGDKVLITAAAGGTGHIAVQWAKAKGCHVIGTCSSPEKAEYLKSIGCDFVIDYKKENIDEVLTKEYPNGVDVIWETIGGDMTNTLFKHLAIKGRLVVIGAITGYKSGVFSSLNVPDLSSALLLGSKHICGFIVSHYSDMFPQYMKQLIAKYKNGEIKVRIDNGEKSEDGPFKGINSITKAVNYLHSGKSYGKVVVHISD